MFINKPNYRIYALIIGEILKPGKIINCKIKKITLNQQKKRKFSPIQSIFSEDQLTDHYKTYASTLRYLDPIKIKSEYVIICDIYEWDMEAALGGAIRNFDKISRYLTLTYAQDFKNYTKRNSILMPYLYQVNKISSLDENGNESDLKYSIESGNIYLPNRPELNSWRDKNTQSFFDDILSFHDDILERSIKYLYRSSIGHFVKDSPEKIILDHFKSMEVIIKSLVKNGRFKQKVDKIAKIINLTLDEKEKIKKLWDVRSKYSDTAHPSERDETERYPNQFPVPSNASFLYPYNDFIAADVCIKYFLYKRKLFYIDIHYLQNELEDEFGEINPHCESNHLFFQTFLKNKSKLKEKIIENFSHTFNINKSDIANINISSNKKNAVLQIK